MPGGGKIPENPCKIAESRKTTPKSLKNRTTLPYQGRGSEARGRRRSPRPEGGAEVQHGAVVAGFAARLLARLPGRLPWLWVAGREDLYAPGLVALGLDPGRLVLACARDDAAVLAAMEAGLRGGGFAAVVGEAGRLSRIAARRLQLACLKHGRMGLLLHRWPHGRAAQAEDETPSAVTRWRIGAVASGGPFAPPRWRLALVHARGGVPGEWIVEAGERDAADPVRVRYPPRGDQDGAGGAGARG